MKVALLLFCALHPYYYSTRTTTTNHAVQPDLAFSGEKSFGEAGPAWRGAEVVPKDLLVWVKPALLLPCSLDPSLRLLLLCAVLLGYPGQERGRK